MHPPLLSSVCSDVRFLSQPRRTSAQFRFHTYCGYAMQLVHAAVLCSGHARLICLPAILHSTVWWWFRHSHHRVWLLHYAKALLVSTNTNKCGALFPDVIFVLCRVVGAILWKFVLALAACGSRNTS